MEERINYLIVGVFVVASALALVVLALWAVGGARGEPVSDYTVFFDRDVTGLTLGSPVRFLGIDVGQVNSLSLSDDKHPRVVADIRVVRSIPVDAGTYASLAYQGITGVAFISLASDAGDHGPLPAVSGRAHPVIPTRDVGIAALLSQGPEIVGRVNDLLERAGAFLDDGNRASLAHTLENLDQLTTTLAASRADIAALPEKVDEVLAGVSQGAEQVSLLLESAGPDVLAAADQLNATTEHLANLTGHLDEWFEENDAAMQSFMRSGLGEMPALMENARTTLREIEKLVAELREEPSRIIYRPRQEPVIVEE